MAEGKRRKSKLEPYVDKIGILPDKVIAEMAGAKAGSVLKHRLRHGIPARFRGQGEPLPNEEAILEGAGLPPSPAPKKATKKTKPIPKPKAKKAPAKTREPRAKKPKAEPVVEIETVVEEAPVAETAVEAEPTPVAKPNKTTKKKAAQKPKPIPKPKAKKAPAKTRKPRAKKPKAEPVVEVETVVEADPTPMPVVEAEPVVEPEPAPPAGPAPAAKPKRAYTTRKPRKSKMDPFMDKIGVLSDREVGELAGVSSENVRAFRKRRGIPAQWRGEGKKTPATPVPKAKAVPKAATKRKPRKGKLTPFMDQIGTTPDARIAEMAGTSHANVRAFRIRHDIPARWRGEGESKSSAPVAPQLTLVPTLAPTSAAAPHGRKPRRGKLSPYLEELGILTDKVIADKAGTTVQNVRVYRQRYGIPARWRGEGEPLPNEDAILALRAGPALVDDPVLVAEPAAAPVVEAAPVAEPVLDLDDDLPPEADDIEDITAAADEDTAMVLKGYKVKVVAGDEKTTFVVVGEDIVEAATNAVAALAQRSTEGEVVELKFLANMLGA